ncbi:MAG: 4-(cytidine 5'-diphospho)-2-C-methyl-D-erythritol kinase [Chloroflexota bacterium]
MTALSLDAPAKLNLSLRVVGERSDGYHLLNTEMVLLELADRLLLLPGATGLRVEAPRDDRIPLDRTNLAWRGLLAGVGAEPELVCLALEKRIPAGSGLGGGSSDAAAAWRLGRHAVGAASIPGIDELAALSRLGADVPFFAAATAAARVGGIGEQILPIPVPAERIIVLAHPAFRLSTAAVFAELRPGDLAPDRPGANDLLAPALRLRPGLGDLLREVAEAGGEPRLTGSGSTVFTQTDDQERSAAVAASLRLAGVQVTETRLRSQAAQIAMLDDAPNDAGAPSPSMG